MHENEIALRSMLSNGSGTRTLLGGSGAVKERILRTQSSSGRQAGSCGGVGGGWGNSPEPEAADGSCGGVGGGWGNSPQ